MMKKLAAIMLILTLCVAFAACGNGKKEDTAPQEPDTTLTDPANDATDTPEDAQTFDWHTLADTYTIAYAGMTDVDEPVVYLESANGDSGVFAMLDVTKGEPVRFVGALASSGNEKTITDKASGETFTLTLSDSGDGTITLTSALADVELTECDPADGFDMLNSLGVSA